MDRLGRKGRQTNGDVFGSLGGGRAVPNPLPAGRDDCLPGLNIDGSGFRFHMQHAAQDQRVFVKLRRLSRLHPSRWTLHSSQADIRDPGIHQADELVNELRLVSSCFNSRGAS